MLQKPDEYKCVCVCVLFFRVVKSDFPSEDFAKPEKIVVFALDIQSL